MKKINWLTILGLGLSVVGTIVSSVAEKKERTEEIDKAVAKYLKKNDIENV